MRRRVPSSAAAAGLLALLGLGFPASASADVPDEAVAQAEAEVALVSREAGGIDAAVVRAKAEQMSVEARLANGELLFRTRDYERAIIVFNEILAASPDTPSYPDALYLLGETYYASHEYLSARRAFREVVAKGADPRFQPYLGRSLARLVDVALRVDDLAALQEVFEHLGDVRAGLEETGLTYAKGKAYYARQDYTNAGQAFAAVPSGNRFTHQARYFQALIAMKSARAAAASIPGQRAAPTSYKQAIEAFRVVTELPPDSDEHKHVIDLAWMAVGRLFYEMEQYQQASEAYSKVGRDSPEVDTMLYELAWVYVRAGDVQRAERALEVLSVADPTSSFIADGTLLRGDLLLRAGSFAKALELYQAVRAQYDPYRQSVEAFLDSTKDVSVYYERLSREALDTVDSADHLPTIALRWAREAEDGPAAFAVIEDINQCKALIRQSQHLIERLMALAGASNRVRAFPDLLAGETRALGLLNRLSHARRDLARGLDAVEAPELSGEMARARDTRRNLMGVVQQVPVNQADFDARDSAGVMQWNSVSQSLAQRNVEVDTLNATINGLRRVLKEDAQHGVARDPAAVTRFNAEIDANERELKGFRTQIDELRRHIETGRAQIGLGDARYQNDAVARGSFRDALDAELRLVAAGQAGERARAYAGQVMPLLATTRSQEDHLASVLQTLEVQVAVQTRDLQAKIDLEASRIEEYQNELTALDGRARDLVGHVAERNFGLVRDRLRGIVVRADVGVTEQAWEVREEEVSRVRRLQGERARQEQVLEEELHEVLDDDANPGGSSGGGGSSH